MLVLIDHMEFLDALNARQNAPEFLEIILWRKTVTIICIQGWKEEWDGYQGVYKAGGRQDALWALGQFGDGLRKKT